MASKHRLEEAFAALTSIFDQINEFEKNYGDILKEHSLNDQDVIACAEDFVEKLDEEETLATIAYHFRWDHFCEGVLISKCVAEGNLLRLLKHLQSVQSNKA